MLRRIVGWPFYVVSLALFIVLFFGLRLVWLAYWIIAGPIAFLFALLSLIPGLGFFEAAHDFLVELIDIEWFDAKAAAPAAWVQRLRGVEDW